MTSRFLLAACAPLLALPFGCSGATAGTPSGAPLFASTVAVSTTQTATLRLELRDPLVSGTLEVSNGTGGTSDFLPRGRYSFSGNFVGPAGFNAVGAIPGTNSFLLSGQLPISGGSGAFTLTVRGETFQSRWTRVAL